ncbi:MAG: TetR/AcrR family transcriptional regulator [Streptosporangiaceae bacterium]
MPRSGASPAQGRRYHHGDLRAALVGTAIELIGERGVRNFSLAEASRRLGVAVSAPYAHFADRDALLAAVTVHAFETFAGELLPGMDAGQDPAARLAAMARGYIRFAASHRALFEVVYQVGLDKARFPEIAAAERPLSNAFAACVTALSADHQAEADDLATAVEATAKGHAMFLLDGDFGSGQAAVDEAADRAARATLALIQGRQALRRAAPEAAVPPDPA